VSPSHGWPGTPRQQFGLRFCNLWKLLLKYVGGLRMQLLSEGQE
jgi:hypothetical protein